MLLKTLKRIKRIVDIRMKRAIDFRAWKSLVNVEAFYDLTNSGGDASIRVEDQHVLTRSVIWSMFFERRRKLKRKIMFGLVELTAITNPVRLKKQIGHPFHLVTPSILPVTMSVAFFCVFQNFIGFMWFEGWHFATIYQYHAYFFANFFAVILTWILEIFKEEQSAAHTVEMQKGFQYAILLFILSELMLFFSFFWAYFHFTLNSNSFTGGTYIPEGLVVFFWYRIPLLNTLLLLASGLSLTIAHILLVESDKVYRLRAWIKYTSAIYTYRVAGLIKGKNDTMVRVMANLLSKNLFWIRYKTKLATDIQSNSIRYSRDGVSILPKTFLLKYKSIDESAVFTPSFWVLDTVLKGFVFLMYQAYEYTSSMFAINDSVYGAVFFSLTGLHGLHVFVGVMFLFTFVIVALAKEMTDTFSYTRSYSTNKIFKKITRHRSKQASSYTIRHYSHRVAFDGAAWYWHFVDVVWLFVFVFVYWWGFSS